MRLLFRSISVNKTTYVDAIDIFNFVEYGGTIDDLKLRLKEAIKNQASKHEQTYFLGLVS